MDRITKLCSYLGKCKTFADVACDHGYCAEYMLKNKLCESAVISDISEKSLSKAETLLSEYISCGRCKPVCCDGLENIERDTELILIAGIGGEEIVKILKNSFIPKSFVFQPMKNVKELRAYLLENGCKILTDDIFSDGKNYYFIVKGERCGGAGEYTKAQLEYGKDSLNNPVFFEYLKEEMTKKQSYLSRTMSEQNRAEIVRQLTFMNGVYNREIK